MGTTTEAVGEEETKHRHDSRPRRGIVHRTYLLDCEDVQRFPKRARVPLSMDKCCHFVVPPRAAKQRGEHRAWKIEDSTHCMPRRDVQACEKCID